MSFHYPLVLAVAVLVTAAAIAALRDAATPPDRRADRGRLRALAGGRSRRAAIRRHLPYALLLAALPILLIGLARPAAELSVPHVSAAP